MKKLTNPISNPYPNPKSIQLASILRFMYNEKWQGGELQENAKQILADFQCWDKAIHSPPPSFLFYPLRRKLYFLFPQK